MKKLLLAVLAVFSLAIAANASAPKTLNFTGKITDVDGSAITAAGTSVTIDFFTASSGGSTIYTEVDSVNPDADGVFSLTIGNVTALTSTNFDQQIYVQITVAGNALLPRYALTASPYAITAASATSVAYTGITGVPAALTNSLVNTPNTANGLVQLNGTGKLPILDGSNLTGVSATSVAAANVTAGTLPNTVVASTTGANSVNDNSIVSVTGAKVTGNISGNAANITGNLPLTQLVAGTLPTTVVASTTSSNSVNDNSIVSVSGAKVTGNITGNAGSITGNINVTQLNAGTLPANVPASSTTANSVQDNAIVAVSASKLTGQIPTAALPLGYSNMVLLSSTSLASAGASLASVTFTARKALLIIINSVSFSATSIAAIRFNGDTGTNYASQSSDNASASTNRTNESLIRFSEANVGTGASNYEVQVMNISATRKVANWKGGSDQGAPGTVPNFYAGTGVWNNTAGQITSVTLVNENAANTVGAGNFGIGTQLFVFGIE